MSSADFFQPTSTLDRLFAMFIEKGCLSSCLAAPGTWLVVLLSLFLVTMLTMRLTHLRTGFTVSNKGPFAPEGPAIVPVSPDFKWYTAPLKKYRPFKANYNLTMGISKPDPQDWLLLESSYQDRICHHKEVLNSPYGVHTCLCEGDPAKYAVKELYDYCVSFAMARYPKYFRRLAGEKGWMVENTILGTVLPINSAAAAAKMSVEDGRSLLKLLAEHFEEDFLLLEYDPSIEEYRLKACTGIAANGFLWDAKMHMKLTDLHGPIPQYKDRLKMSINRFFHKMAVGDLVQRTTYKVQISDEGKLFLPDGNNSVYSDENLDIGSTASMRLERQQLFRLRKTGFILFTIRTYLYPLSDIRDEGLGPQMAEAMKAWPDDFAKYKHREDWGDVVFSYLAEPAVA